MYSNIMEIKFPNKSDNERFARTVAAAFVLELDPTVDIPDISRAREPLFTGKPEMERSGMGFTIMETFMDSIEVQSEVGKGTRITMTKKLK